jgi:hypothetical protein
MISLKVSNPIVVDTKDSEQKESSDKELKGMLVRMIN